MEGWTWRQGFQNAINLSFFVFLQFLLIRFPWIKYNNFKDHPYRTCTGTPCTLCIANYTMCTVCTSVQCQLYIVRKWTVASCFRYFWQSLVDHRLWFLSTSLCEFTLTQYRQNIAIVFKLMNPDICKVHNQANVHLKITGCLQEEEKKGIKHISQFYLSSYESKNLIQHMAQNFCAMCSLKTKTLPMKQNLGIFLIYDVLL